MPRATVPITIFRRDLRSRRPCHRRLLGHHADQVSALRRELVWRTKPAVFSGYTALWVELAREVNETIHLAVQDTDNDLNTWTWNGTTWATGDEISVNLETQIGVEAFAITMVPIPLEQLRLYNHARAR